MTPLAAPSPTAPTDRFARYRAQAEELEGVFLNTLTKEMFSSIETGEDSFGGGFAEETWRGMQSEQMADAIAKSGGVGLADQLVADLLRHQEAALAPINATGGY